MIAVAELVHLEVAVLAVDISGDGLQAAEEQCLAHNTQVLAERVHDRHARRERQLFERLIVGYFGERVVHDLVEALCGQLLRDAGL